ncbi:vacuolar sorting [Scheffersomyces amazonensis]|uniref:vacuolar sorting n=1 Tax=Scheffersomyces amazonensis TaxID=1078765 RepID=UPI00315CBE7B
MFESLVATLLNRFLGAYIENFDPKQLNIGIWSGDVKLKNLRLKKESLDKFKLPIDVKFGHVGELTLQIPWSNLKGKPVRVIIEDVYVLASPIILEEYDEEEEKARQIQVKLDKLADLDTIEQATHQNADLAAETTTNETFTESLITKIVDNLQVTIKNIHIRYEDETVLTENPYAVGLTLTELSAVSTDESWQPSFIAITQQLTRKLLTLQSLSCYMTTDASSIFTTDHEELLARFQSSLENNNNDSSIQLQYLLKPVSGSGKVTIHKAGTTEKYPHIKADLFFEEFGLELDSQQYHDLLWSASKFHWYIKTYKFRKLRPKVTVEEDPKQWFQFAAQCILKEIHDKNYQWSWASFAKRRDQRKAYIRLYKAKLLNTLKDTEKVELTELEEVLPYEDIKFYRSLTKQEMRQEKRLMGTLSVPVQPTESYVGWVSSCDPTTTTNDDGELDLSLTDEQRQALYDAIDYDDKQVTEAIDIPRDRVKLQLVTSLARGGISIKHHNHPTNLAEIVFEGCTTQWFQRPDSFLTTFQLDEFRVEDGTGTTLYKHIVSVKQLHSHLHEQANSNSQPLTDDPFFQISFENNPLDQSADSTLLGKLKSMTIFYNPTFINEIIKFFTPPKIHLDTIGAIMNAAEATMEGLTSQTRIGLQYALEEHKTMNVKLDLQAPLVILPLEPANFQSPVAILDAGHISVVSDLVDKAKIEEFKAKEQYTEEDWQQLNTLMYDKFSLKLEDAQFLVGSDIKSTMEQLHNDSATTRSTLMLDKLNLNLMLGISILPDAINLARFKVGGEVPSIHLAINDFQYKTIMKIIDAAMPDFSNSESEESSLFNAYGSGPLPQIEELEDEKTEDDKESKVVTSQQHMFEFDFNVGLVHIQLSRCVDAHTLRIEALIDLIGHNLNMNFYKQLNDMHLDLTLGDISLVDRMDRSGVAEFEKLMSSTDPHNQLFKLEYSRNLRIVEFNGKEIEVYDQEINLDIAAVKVVVTRKSLLSVLNFILNTFTDPNAEASPADELNHNDTADEETGPQKIVVSLNLAGIVMVLNEDGLKLATIELSTAHIDVLVVPEAMEVCAKLGALTVHDDIPNGTPSDSELRQLISMNGDNLAELTYKTFDRTTNTEAYDSLVQFKTGAIAITFIEHSVNRIISYLAHFLQMKAIYDRARDAAINQAQMDDAKYKFDILVDAPTIVFPAITNATTTTSTNYKFEKVIANLGEIFMSNEYINHENVISAGIRNVSLSSEFHYDPVTQTAHIVDDLDMSFTVKYQEEYTEQVPTIDITGRMPHIQLHLTDHQVQYLMNISNSIASAFTVDSWSDTEDIEVDAENANAVIKHDTIVQRARHPSLSWPQPQHNETVEIPPSHTYVQLQFTIPSFAITIYNHTDLEVIDSGQLAKFELSQIELNATITHNTHFSTAFQVGSFAIRDIRPHSSNKFADLMPVQQSHTQLQMSAVSDGNPENKNITVMLTVDTPQLIVVLDFLFELQTFVSHSLQKDSVELSETDAGNANGNGNGNGSSARIESGSATLGSKPPSTPPSTPPKVGYSINITNPSIILVADSAHSDTEAIVFKIEQLLITSQNVISLAARNIGLYMTAMNETDTTNYRIIDDFSVSFAYDARDSTPTAFLTNIQTSIDALLVRVSLRDIRLALSIFNRATELYTASQGPQVKPDDEYTLSDQLRQRLAHLPSLLSQEPLTEDSPKSTKQSPQVIVKGEEFNASIGGIRFVLIGDIHELPVLDMNVKPFEIRAINWSTDLNAEAYIESYVNIYNYSQSAWEPLIEPWPISIYASKTMGPSSQLSIEVSSRELAEITVTSRSVALLSQITSLLASDHKLKPRGEDNPYVIVNETGYDVEVWADHDTTATTKATRSIQQDSQISWAFEDWRAVRQNLDSNNRIGVLGVKLVDSPYDEVRNIAATGEGEEVMVLYPAVDSIHNRLVCEIVLGTDNVKTIYLRSTVRIQNDADVAIVVKINQQQELVIESKATKSLPISCVYASTLQIRPHITTNYHWSDGSLFWKDLLHHGASLRCQAASSGDNSSYYFQAQAVYDHEEPLAQIYPHMSLVISAPLEIENLLPFDLDYRLYDKRTRKDWSGSISKGVKSYVHVVSLDSLVLLSVEPRNCGFGKSEFAIINTPPNSQFDRETSLALKRTDGQELQLHIYYPRQTTNSTSVKAVVYCPYVVMNRTGQNLMLRDNGNLTHSSGRGIPTMFSFDGDRNRVQLKIGDSTWSTPLSFDAIGQTAEVKAQVADRQLEMNVGISIAEGEGKYNLSKVVTLAPRYVLRNMLEESLSVVESGSTRTHEVASGEVIPLYCLRRIDRKSLLVKLTHGSRTWSSPFCIDDIGQVFVKVYREGVGQTLMKVHIFTEDATIFIQIENANNSWPFSIRNFTDAEFYIYQSDPNVDEKGETVKHDTPYKPIYYKVPARSVMPYAYDYPNGLIKELVLRSHGRERVINLAEIGNLKPFRLPPTENQEQTIVDLNVVADGPTQSLIITNYDASVSLYKLQDKDKTSSSVSVSQNYETTQDDHYYTQIITNFEGLGISLINTRQQELCYITLRGLELRYNESDLYQNVSVKLKWIQIDNQLYGGIFPIVLYPTVVPKSAISKVKDQTHGVLFIKYATILLQEMSIEIDEDFLFALLDFAKFPGASWNNQQVDRLCDETLEIPAPKKFASGEDIYFEALHLQPTVTNLSFVRTERVNAEDKASSQNTIMFFFNVLTMAIGNINDAPIRLNSLFIENLRAPLPILQQSIQTHYGQEFFYQVHKILGSADFIGNPVGLFRNLSSGVLDAFYEPWQGLMMTDRPQEIGIEFAKGGLSFLKKTVFGFSDSFSKVTGSIAKGLTVATMDSKFQQRRRNLRRNRPKHALYGVAAGANSFFESITSGVTGVALAPIEGASKGGVEGFFKGLGKGVIGLPTKTAIGFFDLASNVSEGIRNTTTVFDTEALDKVRLPRYISPDGVMRPYTVREAQGQYWLKSIDEGVYMNEVYLAHLLLSGEEMCVIVTYRMIVLFTVNTLSTKWIIKFEQIKAISKESTGISIGLKVREGPFIPIPDKANRNFLYEKIVVAVGEFNKHCQVFL